LKSRPGKMKNATKIDRQKKKKGKDEVKNADSRKRRGRKMKIWKFFPK
jgi:hypothetical protein